MMADPTHGGKGDRSRVKDSKTYGDNFDRIFNQQFKDFYANFKKFKHIFRKNIKHV